MKMILAVLLGTLLMSPPEKTVTVKPATELVVIVNNDNPIEKLSIPEVRLYWMRRGTQKMWPTLKTTVLPVDRKGACTEKTIFYKSIIKLSEAETESYFAAKQYQSAETPPIKLATDRDVIQYVADNKAGLGFVNLGSLSEAVKQSVKVVCTVSE
jgi:ABC-type phosphate transport system substrate-binding protein